MRILSFLFALFLIALIGGGGIFAYGLHAGAAPGALPENKMILIENGSSMRGIARTLANEGVIEEPYLFLITAKLTGAKLKAGEYEFSAHISVREAIDLLESGKTYQRHITFAEGLTSVEIVELLKADPMLDGTIDAIPVEGSLLPDTYNYTRSDKRADIINRMASAHSALLNQLWEARTGDIPLTSPEQAVTLASIVEKETGLAPERARVAGVFVNRIVKGMPLQSDPTVIYALTGGKEKLDRALTFKDLEKNSPYNTYVVPGLPPGPIANPGRASLEAVFNPEKHDYLYFVADGTGGHVFAATLDEHNRNVSAWRKINRK